MAGRRVQVLLRVLRWTGAGLGTLLLLLLLLALGAVEALRFPRVQELALVGVVREQRIVVWLAERPRDLGRDKGRVKC